jgi:hypothetical protein
MKRPLILWVVIALCGFCQGCFFLPKSPVDDKWEARVRQWLPVGTSKDEAVKIMTHHGFKCEFFLYDKDSLGCHKLLLSGDLDVFIHFHDGKVDGTPSATRWSKYDNF